MWISSLTIYSGFFFLRPTTFTFFVRQNKRSALLEAIVQQRCRQFQSHDFVATTQTLKSNSGFCGSFTFTRQQQNFFRLSRSLWNFYRVLVEKCWAFDNAVNICSGTEHVWVWLTRKWKKWLYLHFFSCKCLWIDFKFFLRKWAMKKLGRQ